MVRLSLGFVFFLSLPSAFAHIGGISGGGGNVIVVGVPTEMSTVSEAARAVRAAHPLIQRYLSQKEIEYRRGVHLPPIFSKLFQRSILDVANETRPRIRMEKACSDSAGFPVDGSTISKPRTICISAFDIAQKVDRSQLEIQSAALLAHEFSEIAGFTDDQAVELQTQILADLVR